MASSAAPPVFGTMTPKKKHINTWEKSTQQRRQQQIGYSHTMQKEQ
jgi:hypothetical protein